MSDNINGDITIEWADGVEQTVLGNEFVLEQSGKSGDDNFDQLYIAHVEHPDTSEEGKIYLETRVDLSSKDVTFSEPKAEGSFEIIDSEDLDVEGPDYDDDDFDDDL